MKHWALLAAFLAALPAWADDWRATLSPVQPGRFPPPRPLQAVYRFGWSGITAAEADFKFSNDPRGQLRLNMDTKTIGPVRLLWRLDAQHTAVCDAATLRPISLRQTEIYKRETEATAAEFSQDMVRRRTVVTPSSKPPEKEKRFKCADVFDLQTALLFVRSQRLQAGDRYRLVVFPAKSPYLAEIEVVGRERVKVAAGSFDAIKCRVRLQGVTKKLKLAPHRKFKRAFAWVSDDSDRLLLKISAEIFVGSVWAELQSVRFSDQRSR